MSKVAIVTDGVNDLSLEIIEKYDIFTVPYRIFFGDEVYRVWHNEKSTISLEDFCVKLTKCSKDDLPSTSLPSPGDFMIAFEDALEKADSVIAILISGGLSGAVQAAHTVANTILKDKDITIFDSRHTMTGTGIQALEAAKMAKEGRSKKEILSKLESMNLKVRTVFIMNDLKYLYRKGRIGRAKKLLASTFKVIPCVHLEDGIICPLGAFKGNDKLIEQMKYFGKKIIEHAETGDVFLNHINHHEAAEEIFNSMKEANGNGTRIHFNESAPVMGVYTGPKSICISYIGNWDKKWIIT